MERSFSGGWKGLEKAEMPTCRDIGDGARRIRTADLLGAIQALCQLSYSPTCVAGRFIPEAAQEQG